MPSLASSRVSVDKDTPKGLAGLAATLRTAQFVAHAAHNLVRGPSFFADHAWFGSAYDAYETAYDSVVERAIGLGEQIDLAGLTAKAATAAAEDIGGTEADNLFRTLLRYEEQICDACEDCCEEECSDGTENLVQGIADQSEARVYQIRQRLSD